MSKNLEILPEKEWFKVNGTLKEAKKQTKKKTVFQLVDLPKTLFNFIFYSETMTKEITNIALGMLRKSNT